MGYWSLLHLIDVRIKAESIPVVKRILESAEGPGLSDIQFFLQRAVVDSAGFLVLKANKDDISGYCPDEEGTVPALSAKWYTAESIAAFLRQHCEKGGRLVHHSLEGDGHAWGWEFDGRGRMRALALRPIGKWQ